MLVKLRLLSRESQCAVGNASIIVIPMKPRNVFKRIVVLLVHCRRHLRPILFDALGWRGGGTYLSLSSILMVAVIQRPARCEIRCFTTVNVSMNFLLRLTVMMKKIKSFQQSVMEMTTQLKDSPCQQNPIKTVCLTMPMMTDQYFSRHKQQVLIKENS